MELRQLEYFVAVAEEANFTRAAEREHVAQPGVSSQIRRLERELGQELLNRSGRSIALTDVGAAVLPYARAAIAAVNQARLVVDEYTGLLRGHVNVGMVSSCTSVHLPDILAGFHTDHPAVEITLQEAPSDQLVSAVQDGSLDLALISQVGAVPPGLSTHVIANERLVAAVGPDDPLAGLDSVSFDGVLDRPLISLPPGTGLRAVIDRAWAAAGHQPRVVFEASDPRMLAQLAVRGLGVAILPESLANAKAGFLHLVPIDVPGLRVRLAFAWLTQQPTNPAARALISRVSTVTANVPAGESDSDTADTAQPAELDEAV